MIATLFHRELTSAANHRQGHHSGAQYTGTCVKRPGKQELQQNIQRFVKDVRHLILEVLRSHCVFKHKINKRETFVKLNGRRTKSVQRISPIFVFEGKNFIASTANIRVDVEQIETRYGTDVKDANVGSKNGARRVKAPVPVLGVDR